VTQNVVLRAVIRSRGCSGQRLRYESPIQVPPEEHDPEEAEGEAYVALFLQLVELVCDVDEAPCASVLFWTQLRCVFD